MKVLEIEVVWKEARKGAGLGKFLLAKGEGNKHTLYVGWHVSHLDLAQASGLYASSKMQTVIAAGNFKNNCVTAWMSEGFRIYTPRELEPAISAAIANLKED